MNDIRDASNQDDLEILKSIVPQWQQAKPEPFLKSAQQDVSSPEWNKIKMESDSQQSGSAPQNIQMIPGASVFNGIAWRANIAAELISPF